MTIPKPPPDEYPLLKSSRFTILRQLGAGAFGVVYEVDDKRQNTRVALKMLRNLNGNSLYSFKREFRSLTDIAHPNLVGLHELFSEDGLWFFTMDLVDGTDFLSFIHNAPLSKPPPPAPLAEALATTVELSEESRMRDTLPEDAPNPQFVDEKKTNHSANNANQPEAPHWIRLRSVLVQLAQGLCALHAAGKVHRDLKPSNVFVTYAGHLVILDFGLAVDIAPVVDHSAERVAGTPAYMAPEQSTGEKATPASDWYAVGVMLYEALTNRLPFQGTPAQVLFSKQVEEPMHPARLVPDAPADLAALALELMRRSPSARPSGRDVLQKLTRHLPEPSVPSSLPRVSSRAFVGRKEEMTVLRDAFDWIRAGRALTVHVRGESGMGKSTLVRHFLEALAQEYDVVILAGRCYEREAVPFKGIDSLIDAASRHLGRLPKDAAEALLPTNMRALVQLFPVLGRVAVVADKIRQVPLLDDSGELRQQAFAALRELFVRMAKVKPLVLHLDDVQWGDSDSAALLEYLFEGPNPPAMLLLLSYRSNDAEQSAMLREMPRPNLLTSTAKNLAAIQDLFIGPLSEPDAFSLALQLLGDKGPRAEKLARSIAVDAQGSPFYVAELLRGMLAGTLLSTRSIRLDAVLGRRLLQLPENARRLLEIVAIASRPILARIASQAAAIAAEEEASVLAMLRAASILRVRGAGDEQEIETFHDRVRETVLAQMTSAQQIERQLQMARALAALNETSLAPVNVQPDPIQAIGPTDENGADRSQVDPGTVVKHYEIIRKLGAGGMGAVYLARDTRLGRRVAIKFLLDYSGSAAQRFLLEARTTAQCRHENIVVIYDVDEFQGHPYMVLEFIEGRTLRDFLRENSGNEPRREAITLELIRPVVRALVCAHEAQIVHRDLKPENILLTNSGEVRVVDFGIAKQVALDLPGASFPSPASTEVNVRMTQTGAMVGTLAYMAPEQWIPDESIDARVDIWALGIILFELVVGDHPLAPLTPYGLSSVPQLDEPMPCVRDRKPGAGPIAEIIDRCLAKRKEDRYASTKELFAALEAVGHDDGASVGSSNEDEAPFTGLSAFQEADAARFFGRESDIAAFMGRLRHQELLTITGASGAGKSSFVRAGIIPAFKRSTPGAEALVVRPGLRPLAALADLLGTVTQTDPSQPSIHDVDEIVDLLRSRPGAFGARLRARCRERGQAQRILLFVDQLEELYTLGISPEDRAAFHACLCGAADDASSPLRVVLAVRADFLDRMSEDRSFMSVVTRGLVFLSPIGRESLHDALEKPLAITKYRFEDEDLVHEMLDAVAGSKSPLPLLQFTATKLWEARDRDNRLLTWVSYRALGGVVGALSVHADAVLAGMSSREQRLARLIFVRLVTPERTRAIVPWEELCAIDADREAVAQVIDRLANARILAVETSGEEAERLVELLHESLIERWAKLGSWLDENAHDAQFLAELRQAAQQWEKNENAAGFLWRDRAATMAEQWLEGRKAEETVGLGNRELEYLSAVIKLAQRTKRRQRATVVGLVAAISVVAVVVGALAIRAQEQAKQARENADKARENEGKAQENAIKANEKAVEANDAKLMAGFRELRNTGQVAAGLALLRLVKKPELARDWITLANEALDLNALEVTLRGGEQPFSMAAWSADGKRIAAASLDGKIWIWSADERGKSTWFKVVDKPIHSLDFSPDGQHLLVVSEDGQAHRVGLDGKELTPLGTSLESARFMPNKPLMVLTLKDGTVRIEELSGKGSPILLKEATTKLHRATPSADGSAIVTTADDNLVRVWRPSGNTWKAVVHRDLGRKVLQASLSFDGKRLVTASGNDTVLVGSADGQGEATALRVDGDRIEAASFSADGRYVLGRAHARNLYVWPAAGGAPRVMAGAHDGSIAWAGWGPEGTRALSISGTVAKVWRFPQLEALPRSRRPRLYAAAIEADGEHAVAAFDDHTVRRFGLGEPDTLVEVSRADSWITGLAVSPQGNRRLVALKDGTVRIEEGFGADTKTQKLSGTTGLVSGGAFARDGMRVVTYADDGNVRIWRLENGGWNKQIDLSERWYLVTDAVWSPDSQRLVTSSEDGMARLWDVSSGELQGMPLKHDGPVESVAWSPDGQKIATSSLKHGLRVLSVWNLSKSEPRLEMEMAMEMAVTSPLIALKFLDRGRIVGISEDGATHQFLVDVHELMEALAQSNRDCLSPEQRGTYLGEPKGDAQNRYAECEQQRGRTPMHSQPAVEQAKTMLPPDQVRASLEVVPVDATVDVDGVRVPRRAGLIDLVRKNGDAWQIRVSLGSTVIEQKVALQKGTLSPSKIDLFEATATQAKQNETPARFDTED